MADDKSLKIGIKVDDKGTKVLNSSLKDTQKQADSLKVSISKLTAEFVKFDKELANKVKDLKKFQDALKETDRVINNTMKNMASAGRGMGGGRGGGSGGGGLGFPLGGINWGWGNNYGGPAGNLGSGGGSGLATQRGINPYTGSSGGTNERFMGNAQRVDMPGGSASTPMFVNVVGGGGTGSGTPGAGDDAQRSFARIGAALLSLQAISGVAGFVQELKTGQVNNLAQLNSPRGSMMRNMIGGDFSDAYFMNRYKGEGGLKNAALGLDIAGGTAAMKTESGANVGADVLKAGATGAIGGGLFGTLFGGIGAAPGALLGGLGAAISTAVSGIFGETKKTGFGTYEVNEMQTQEQQRESFKRMHPEQQIMLEQIQSQAGARYALDKALGGRGGQAVGQGIGYGMEAGEAAGFFGGIANRFGATATMGAGGQRGFGATALDMGARGFQPEAVTEFLGAAYNNRSNLGKDTAERLRSANTELEKIITKAFTTGIEDAALGQEIMEGVTRAMMGGGMGEGSVLASFLAGGANSTKQDIRNRETGLSVTAQALQENPYFSTRSAGALKKAMGADYDQDVMLALRRATSAQRLGGSDEAAALLGGGVIDEASRAKARKYGNIVQRSEIEDAIDWTALSGNKTARDLLASFGGDKEKFLRDPRGRNLAATLMGNIQGTGDLNSRVGLIEATYSPGVDIGGKMPGQQGGISRATLAKQAELKAVSWAKIGEADRNEKGEFILDEKGNKKYSNREAFDKSLKEATLMFDSLGKIDGASFESYKKTADVLMNLVNYLALKHDAVEAGVLKVIEKVNKAKLEGTTQMDRHGR